jgi:chemotaxis protein MotD
VVTTTAPATPAAPTDAAQQPVAEAAIPAEIPVLAPVKKVEAKKDKAETDTKTDGDQTDATADTAEQPQVAADAAPQPVPATTNTPVVPVQAAPVAGTADPAAPKQGGDEAVVAATAEAKGQPKPVADAPATLPQPQQAAAKTDTAETKTDTAKTATPAKPELAGSKPADDSQQTAAAPEDPAQPAQPAKGEQTAAAEHEDKKHIARARGETPETARGAAPRAEANFTTPNTDGTAPTHAAAHAAAQHNSATQASNSLAATQTPAAPQANTPATVPVPLASVGFEIASKATAGDNHFDIRLDPPELGRIEVRLHVDRDGNVTSHLIADRKDTLDLLKRDSSGLERALQDAGLKTSDNGMQFSLRDQSANQQQNNDVNNAKTAHIVVPDDVAVTTDIPVQTYGRLSGRLNGLDIRV